MTESFASSDQSGNINLQGAYSNTHNNENNHNRKQKRRPVETSSQDVRYNQRPNQHHQQQQQQQWYPSDMYYDEYYYRPQSSRGGHHNYNYYHQQQQQQRRPQHRHPAPHTQVHQQGTVRPNSNSSSRSTSEVENLRSTLTEQLFENIYECMICIIKIEYVFSFNMNKLIYNFFRLFSLVEIKKYGRVIFVIKCFI